MTEETQELDHIARCPKCQNVVWVSTHRAFKDMKPKQIKDMIMDGLSFGRASFESIRDQFGHKKTCPMYFP